MAKNKEITYWQLVSQSMELEDRRLRMFVSHKHSLGIGRENILRKFLAEQTPEPYRLSTGFVAHPGKPSISSDQCDVLVYDPRVAQPLYSIEQFVVLPPEPSRVAIEVRSTMSACKKSGLEQVFKVHLSLMRFGVYVQGFGFRGPAFDTFVAGVAARVNGDIRNVPDCIAVHRQNYVCLQGTVPSTKPDVNPCCVAINFAHAGQKAVGLATAYFQEYFQKRVQGDRTAVDLQHIICNVCGARLGMPSNALRAILNDGTVRSLDPWPWS